MPHPRAFLTVLNEALECDREAVRQLITVRVECTWQFPFGKLMIVPRTEDEPRRKGYYATGMIVLSNLAKLGGWLLAPRYYDDVVQEFIGVPYRPSANITVAAIVGVLQRCSFVDSGATRTLLLSWVSCTGDALARHPTIVVDALPGGATRTNLIGLLSGIVAADGRAIVGILDSATGGLMGFQDVPRDEIRLADEETADAHDDSQSLRPALHAPAPPVADG
jgi:hypothetical protein